MVALVVLTSSVSGGAAAIDGLLARGTRGTSPVRLLRRESERATLSLRAFDAESRAPLAVRVRLQARGMLAEPEIQVDANGKLDLTLVPDDYTVVVSHGPEWSLYEAPLSLTPSSERVVQVFLRRAVQAERWTACDLHVHSEHSPDADLSLATRAASLKAEDIHFAVLTDHNTVTHEAVEQLRALGIGALPGVEVTTWQPEFGHFNLFPASHVPKYRHTNEGALLAEIRRDPEAFIQINHPRLERHIGYFELRSHEPSKQKPLPFDGLEVWNGYDITRPARRDALFHEWLSLLAHGQRIVATGGSDSHHLRAPFAGYPRAYVDVPRAEAGDAKRVLAALRAGRSFVSSGPILELRAMGLAPGDTLSLRPGQTHIAVEVRADGPAWMDLSRVELWLDQRRVASADLAQHGLRNAPIQFELPVAQQHSLVAVVRGERGMRALLGSDAAQPYAFTNPIWLRRHK